MKDLDRLVVEPDLYGTLHECVGDEYGLVTFAVWQTERSRIVDAYVSDPEVIEPVRGAIAQALRTDQHAYLVRVYTADVFDATADAD